MSHLKNLNTKEKLTISFSKENSNKDFRYLFLTVKQMSANEIQVSWETHCFIHYTYIHIYVVIVLVATN